MSATPAPPKPAAPPTPAPSPSPPRTGTVREDGVVRRDAVHALAWEVRGTAKVLGDVDAGAVTVRGDLSVGGGVTADRVATDGEVETVGAIRVAGPWRGRGEVRAGKTVGATDLEFTGIVRAAAAVTVDRTLRIDGTLAAPDVTAGELRLDGAAEVPGTVVAVVVDLRLKASSQVGTIRAKKVRVVGHRPTPVDEVLFRRHEVKVDRIEADEVEVEDADVGFVRSPRIVLGRGSHVTTVEGTVAKRHASARVGPESKSPPPYGLRR